MGRIRTRTGKGKGKMMNSRKITSTDPLTLSIFLLCVGYKGMLHWWDFLTFTNTFSYKHEKHKHKHKTKTKNGS